MITAFDPLDFDVNAVYHVTISDGTVDHVVELVQVDAMMRDETNDTTAQGSFDVRDLSAGDVLKVKVLDDGSSLNVLKLERKELAPVV